MSMIATGTKESSSKCSFKAWRSFPDFHLLPKNSDTAGMFCRDAINWSILYSAIWKVFFFFKWKEASPKWQ